MILYEHPFNERTRFMIRLEYLFKRLFAFSKSTTAEGQHVAFAALFDLLDVCERGDCRTWVIQEIEKKKMSLEAYRNFPEIDVAVLDQTIAKLNRSIQDLAKGSKLGSHLRENEWLQTLRNRFLVPGATSSVDMPSYTAWLSGQELDRVNVLQSLIEPFMPLYEAITQALHILRDAAEPMTETSNANGIFEKSVGGKIYQMARIWVPQGQNIYPEISGNKHVIMIRFHSISANFRQRFLAEPVAFKMALCHI